ncbi:hypothetical protein RPMA_12310 [Tardiphaga alba]|uniref:GcrA cell cycle regulator n=1 Tax=Tardiphaga alba TaxID=340268 RepID=A0ABX8ACJ3_9BRAD|nr:GcrA family cell cycle regulator [Tardiphaga alba]QUS39530.1 hypothetical protein RPMA_12310 [Tardiphaga alba]
MRVETEFRAAAKWTPEQDEQLKKLVMSNRSFRDAVTVINTEHGTSFSRSAAIGRANRLGLCNPMPKSEQGLRKSRRVEKILEAKKKRQDARPLREPKFKAEPVEAAPAFAGMLGLSLHDLFEMSGDRPNQCRAIEGDTADALYCGATTRAGRAWCDHHHGRFTTKPEPRLRAADASRRGRKVSNYVGSHEAA